MLLEIKFILTFQSVIDVTVQADSGQITRSVFVILLFRQDIFDEGET